MSFFFKFLDTHTITPYCLQRVPVFENVQDLKLAKNNIEDWASHGCTEKTGLPSPGCYAGEGEDGLVVS